MDITVFEEFCDKLMIPAEEGFFTSLIEKSNNASNSGFKINKAGNGDFDRLVKEEAFCAEGITMPYAYATCQYFYNKLKDCKGAPNEMRFYWCYGKDLNEYYHLTGDNQYDKKLGIFFVDWSNFGSGFKSSENKGPFRFFSDVVDANARREIRKGNPHYKNYHSIYGDEWFYKTI